MRGPRKTLIIGDTKRCSQCGVYKPFAEYHKNAQSKLGVYSTCKACKNHPVKSTLFREGKKRCSKCRAYKAFSDFNKHKGCAGGIQSQCRDCQIKSTKRKYKDKTDRFWKFYHAHISKVGSCVEWTGTYNEHGEPFYSNKRVRRLVYGFAVGSLLDGMCIVTTCNNKRCVRHGHLKQVTKAESLAKCWNSLQTGDQHWSQRMPERIAKGEKRVSAKLTEESVRQARQLYEQGGISIEKLAQRFGVTYGTMYPALRRRTWTHVE